jgi:hypothetical protein
VACEIGDYEAGASDLCNLVINLSDMLDAVDTQGVVPGLPDTSLEASSVCLPHLVVKPHSDKALSRCRSLCLESLVAHVAARGYLNVDACRKLGRLHSKPLAEPALAFDNVGQKALRALNDPRQWRRGDDASSGTSPSAF